MLLPEPGAIYVMDRGYVDFARLHVLNEAGLVTRAKSNINAHRCISDSADRSAGVISDQTIAMDGYLAPATLSCASAAHSLQRTPTHKHDLLHHQVTLRL